MKEVTHLVNMNIPSIIYDMSVGSDDSWKTLSIPELNELDEDANKKIRSENFTTEPDESKREHLVDKAKSLDIFTSEKENESTKKYKNGYDIVTSNISKIMEMPFTEKGAIDNKMSVNQNSVAGDKENEIKHNKDQNRSTMIENEADENNLKRRNRTIDQNNFIKDFYTSGVPASKKACGSHIAKIPAMTIKSKSLLEDLKLLYNGIIAFDPKVTIMNFKAMRNVETPQEAIKIGNTVDYEYEAKKLFADNFVQNGELKIKQRYPQNMETSVEKSTLINFAGAGGTKFPYNSNLNGETGFVEENTSSNDSDIKTLEDSLKYFGFYQRLQELERSLEAVRRNRKTKEDHESELKKFDKEMQKLSSKYHPDKARNRGESEERVLRAHKLQTALNATRKVMNILNKIFLEDIDIDHKYEFFTKLNISFLGNEDAIENYVYEVLFKISLISEIKQRHIIAEIRKFIIESQSCIDSYCQDNVTDFEKHSISAISRLKNCIRGYKKLLTEFQEVEEECNAETLDNIYYLIRKMRKDCVIHLTQLEKLLHVSEYPFKGTFKIFTSTASLDEYFVLPLVCYMDVILMCGVMMKNSREIKILGNSFHIPSLSKNSHTFQRHHDQTAFLADSYHLASVYSGNSLYKNVVRQSLGKEHVSKQDIKEKFLAVLFKVNEVLRNKFKIDYYTENGTKRYISEVLNECKKMKAEFEEKKKEFSRDIEKISKNSEEMKQKLDKIMGDSLYFKQKVMECSTETSMLERQYENYLQKKK